MTKIQLDTILLKQTNREAEIHKEIICPNFKPKKGR